MCRRSGCSGAPDKTEPWKRRFLQVNRKPAAENIFKNKSVSTTFGVWKLWTWKMRRRTHNRELAPIRENRIHCPELSTNTCVSVWLWVCVCERGKGGMSREREEEREWERERESFAALFLALDTDIAVKHPQRFHYIKETEHCLCETCVCWRTFVSSMFHQVF